MAPPLPSATTKLSYPVYCADFDPLNQDFLLVGGGGGSSSTGVPNRLSLLDCSNVHELKEVVDVELSKHEDSVSSLAVAQSSETSLIAYGGINSSPSDQHNGRNEHLRSFRIDLPRKRKADEGPAEEKQEDEVAGTTEALGRAQFFACGPKSETYQRVVRMSPAGDGSKPRITAIATGLAQANEVVLLKVGPAPGHGNEIARLDLGDKEAVDLDFAPAGAKEEHAEYTMAYCSEYDVSLYRLSAGSAGVRTQTRVVYSTPEGSQNAKRPRFRALRFLSPKHILLLQNLPDRKGVELLILKRHKDGTSAVVSLKKRLGKAMKTATGLDVCILSESSTGNRQILVAVAGNNNTIEILYLEFSKEFGMSSFSPYTTLKDVHSGPITGLVFSTFIPPSSGATKDTNPQSVKLASVCVEQTVIVHTLRLRPFLPSPNNTSRYVLVSLGNTDLLSTTFSVFMAVLVIGIAALMLQVFSEIRGAVPPILGASEWLPSNVKDTIAKPYNFADAIPDAPAVSKVPEVVASKAADIADLLQSNEYYAQMLADATAAVKAAPSSVSSAATALTDLVASQATAAVDAAQGAKQKAIVVRDVVGQELSTELHDDAELVQKETLRKWEDLHESEKVSWRKRLIDAGHWTANQGESVLKGVFFSELAGLAAQMEGA